MTFDAYFDPERREPAALSTPAEVNELLNQMEAEAGSPDVAVGLVAQLDCKGEDGWRSVLQFGVRRDATVCGFVGYMGKGESSAISDNGGTSPEPVAYDYQCHEREVPSNAEITWPTVRRAVHDYVESGGARPAGVRWREISY